MSRLRMCAALPLLLLAAGLSARPPVLTPVPVLVGLERHFFACNNGAVSPGLPINSGARVTVYAGRHDVLETFVPVAVLQAGDRVYECDYGSGYLDDAGQVPWVGVVVAQAGRDCGLAEVYTQPRAYSGPCVSGWVRAAELAAALP